MVYMLEYQAWFTSWSIKHGLQVGPGHGLQAGTYVASVTHK